MRKIRFLLLGILLLGLIPAGVEAQQEEAEQLLLDVAKLIELKKILNDLKSGYEIVSKGYNTVKNLSEGNFNLHKTFLDGLMAVSPTVKNYRKVADIALLQLQIVKEYKAAIIRFKQDKNFNEQEITYLSQVYSNLTSASLKNLEALTTIITASKLRMSDDERLGAIDTLFDDMQDKLTFLRHFNNSTNILALQRAKERNNIQSVQSLYGINK